MPTDKSVGSQRASQDTEKKAATPALVSSPTAERRLCQGLYNNTEKAKFGFEKSC